MPKFHHQLAVVKPTFVFFRDPVTTSIPIIIIVLVISHHYQIIHQAFLALNPQS